MKSSKKNSNAYIFAAAIVIIAIIIITYYVVSADFQSTSGSIPHVSIRLFNVTYNQSYNNCLNPAKAVESSGFEKVCTEIINATSVSSLLPSYFIINYYKMSNSTAAQDFINNLGSNFNTTPWPQAYAYVMPGKITDATIIYPDYSNTNRALMVLAAYARIGDGVLSVSTGNFTGSNISMTKNSVLMVLNYTYSKIGNA